MTLEEFLDDWRSPSATLLVHTSGSTGKPKPMVAGKRRMAASARRTCSFLGLRPGDSALLCMPLDYIAGKMVAVRAEVCGLRLIAVEPSSHPLASLAEAPDFAAMVPLQVCRSLEVEGERRILKQIRHLIIGGGAVDEALESELRGFPNAVWSTYGMTETLSHVALRRISGSHASEWYTPFDGVEVALSADGCLVIDAPEVCGRPLPTNDRALLHEDGRRFRIIGRKDNVIDSGGVKIQIEEVEKALGKRLDMPFMITKRKDPVYGEAVVMLYQSENDADRRLLREKCVAALPKYWVPQDFVRVEELPLTATGKPARKRAEEMAAR